MANNIITHQGIVESIDGSHLTVRIVQTSACSTCSIKGHCSSAESKEKLIDVLDNEASAYRAGDRVLLVGTTSMGMQAVTLAFIFPFILLIISLFIFMAATDSELFAALFSLVLLAPYYFVLWLMRGRLKQRFMFTVEPIKY